MNSFSHSPLRFVGAILLTTLCATTVVDAKGGGMATIAAGSGSGLAGDTVTVQFTVQANVPVSGFNFNVCHDPTVLSVVNAVELPFQGAAMSGPEISGVTNNPSDTGIFAIMAFAGGNDLDATTAVPVLQITYELIGQPGDISMLMLCQGSAQTAPAVTQGAMDVNPLVLMSGMVEILQIPGETCQNAIAVNEGSFQFDNTGTMQDGPSTCDGDISTDLWYLYTATQTGDATIDTCTGVGTLTDTVIIVYDAAGGCPMAPDPGLACDDDTVGCGPSGFNSSVTIPVVTGGQYYIQVGGRNGTEGTATLNITVGCLPPSALTCTTGPGGVSLGWTNGAAYSSIDVERDSIVIATIPGTATSYVDPSPSAGLHTYNLVATCTAGGAISESAPCEVNAIYLICDSDVPATGGSASVPIRLQHVGGLVQGGSFGLLHDPTKLTPTGATNPGDVMLDFELLSLFPTGVTYAFIADQNPPFDNDIPPLMAPNDRIVEIVYAVTLGTPSGPTPLTFTNTIGMPFPVALEVTFELVGVTPITIDGSVLITGNFIRGDCNADGQIGLIDAIRCLELLFMPSGVPDPMCDDAQDVNNDGQRTITDALYLLGYLFGGTAPPPAPFPNCGTDPDVDMLDCAVDPFPCNI